MKPLLRFRADDGSEFPEWEEHNLSMFLEENRLRNVDLNFGKNDVLSVSGDYGVVNQIELQGRSFAGKSVQQYHILPHNGIVYTKSPLKANPYGIIKANKGIAGIVSTLYAVFDCKNNVTSEFVDLYFDLDERLNKYLKPLVNIGAKHDMKISNERFLSGRVCFPSLPEQRKIASFLSTIDEIIQSTESELTAWQERKKGVMQKIFNREVRFKADDGSEFPEWEEKRLGEVCEPLMYGMGAAAIPYDGQNKYIRITDIDDETHKYKFNDLVSPGGMLEEKYIVCKGDILLARTGASTGKSYLYNEKDGKMYFAGFLIKAHVNDECDARFIYAQTLTMKYKNWVKLTSMRSGQPGINANEYSSYTVSIASLPEQKKIADCLSSLDDVINQIQAELSAWKEFKKGLLQQMFV